LLDILSDAPVDTSSLQNEESEVDLARLAEELGDSMSCHLGLMVEGFDRPMSYAIRSLEKDAPLYQNPLVRHSELGDQSSTSSDSIILGEQAADETNAWYMTQINAATANSLLVDDDDNGMAPTVEVSEPWFTSMMGVESCSTLGLVDGEEEVEKKPDPSVLERLLNPSSVQPSPFSSTYPVAAVKLETSDSDNVSSEADSSRMMMNSNNKIPTRSLGSERTGGNNGRIVMVDRTSSSPYVSNDSMSVLMHNKENSRRVTSAFDSVTRNVDVYSSASREERSLGTTTTQTQQQPLSSTLVYSNGEESRVLVGSESPTVASSQNLGSTNNLLPSSSAVSSNSSIGVDQIVIQSNDGVGHPHMTNTILSKLGMLQKLSTRLNPYYN
jgi:hypothetical protein